MSWLGKRLSAAAIQPLVIAIDVEPQRRRPDPGRQDAWIGFERMLTFLEPWRARLAAATGRPCRFTWFVAVSPQVEAIYGDAAWPLLHYRAEFARCAAAGDEIGLHVHFWRPAPDLPGSWVIDYEDRAWMEAALRQAFRRFAEVMGRPCRLNRFGDGWLAGWALDLVAGLGAAIDVTLEPGWPPRSGHLAEEVQRGWLPDLRDAPIAPYRRGRGDFRRPARFRGRGPWMLPVASGRLGPAGEGPFTQLMWGLPPAELSPLLDRALDDPCRPVVVSVMRSDIAADAGLRARLEASFEHLLGRADIARHPVLTPTEALAALRRPIAAEAPRPLGKLLFAR
jgi:hypothetical protein